MRLSELFFTTLRDDPGEAEMPSHRLLLRAGYVRPLGSGIYSLLPLGKKVSDRVEQVIREEMDAIGCQEMSSIPPRSGRTAAATSRSDRSSCGSRTAASATWSSP
jgi:prolyl-tRNA synthetase